MFDFNDIMSAVKDGYSLDEIADAFADRLNEVEEAMEAEAAKSDFEEACEAAAEAWTDVVATYFDTHELPEDLPIETFNIPGEVIGEMVTRSIEDTLKLHAGLGKLSGLFGQVKNMLANDPEPKDDCDMDDAEQAIADFLKSLGI